MSRTERAFLRAIVLGFTAAMIFVAVVAFANRAGVIG
jgi:hypothetical protein